MSRNSFIVDRAKIKALIAKEGLTMVKVADELGISLQHLSNSLRKGEMGGVATGTMLKFADLLDVGLLELELIEDTRSDQSDDGTLGGIDDDSDSATTDAS